MTKPSSKPTVSVDLRATPKGWVPVDYGLAQISVPANWNVEYDSACDIPHAPGTVFVGDTGNGDCIVGPIGNSVPAVELRPGVPGQSSTTGRMVVNGITVYRTAIMSRRSQVGVFYRIPALAVDLDLYGRGAEGIIDTLSRSPRSVVLAHGPFAPVPSSWRLVSFHGIRFAAPKGWPQRAISYFGEMCGSLGLDHEVTLSTDAHRAPVAFCQFEPAIPKVKPPTYGIRVDAIPALALPKPAGTGSFPRPLICKRRHGLMICTYHDPKSCMKLHGLSVCSYGDPPFAVLYLLVSGPHLKHPVVMELGLAGTGEVARTILGSLRGA